MIKSYLTLDHKLILKNVNIPTIKNDEILLKVLSCAICGSDLKISQYGNDRIVEDRTIGHEIAGEISLLGSEIKNYNIGDKVSIAADLPCNECSYCKSGRVNLCHKNLAVGYQIDGGFSQYMVLNKFILNNGPIQKFFNITPDEACLAEPLACAINGVKKSIQCFSSEKINNSLIYGGGPIGLLIAEYLFYKNIKDIVIVEPNLTRLNFINNNTEFKCISNSLDVKNNFDLVFTACSVLDTHEDSLKKINKSGVINFFGGLPKNSKNLSLSSNEIHYKEIVILGTHGSTPNLHKLALTLLENKDINLDYLITDKYPLKDINRAFTKAQSGESLKIIINPNE